MTINKEKLHRLISMFYQPTFKMFYVNTLNGKEFTNPIGIFVSLGITTSKKTLDDLRQVIASHDGYKAVLAEIKSVKDGMTGQYLNLLTNIDNPNQYLVEDYGEDVMDREQAMAELERIRELMNFDQPIGELTSLCPKVSRLNDLINRLEPDGWNSHYIQKENEDYRIFHRYVNYRRDEDTGDEYRIGIFVS